MLRLVHESRNLESRDISGPLPNETIETAIKVLMVKRQPIRATDKI